MNVNRFEVHRVAELHPTLKDSFVATLLIPAFLKKALQDHLELNNCGLSILLRHLVYKYRKQILARDMPVNHFYRRAYQASGLNLQKRNLRPEPEVWELFSLFAEYLGVSRCYLFTLLLWIDISREEKEEGVPTSRLEHYDLHYPRFVEFRKRLYPGRIPRMRREIHSQPEPPEKTPHWLFPYPENIEWMKYVFSLETDGQQAAAPVPEER